MIIEPKILESLVLVVRADIGATILRAPPEKLLRYFNEPRSEVFRQLEPYGEHVITRSDLHIFQVIWAVGPQPSRTIWNAFGAFRAICRGSENLDQFAELQGEAKCRFHGGMDFGEVLVGPCDPAGEVISSATAYADEAYECGIPLVIRSEAFTQLGCCKLDLGISRHLKIEWISAPRRDVVCLGMEGMEELFAKENIGQDT